MKRNNDPIFTKIVDNCSEGVILTDMKGKINFINHTGIHITGWTSEVAIGKDLVDVLRIFDEKTNQQYVTLISDIIQAQGDFELNRNVFLRTRNNLEKDIACKFVICCDESKERNGIIIYFREITEQRKFEKEFQNALRLNSLGKLSSGIAHDFNNVLTTILGNISLAKLDISEKDEIFGLLSEAEVGIEKARVMTQQLLSFSSIGKDETEILKISEILKEFVTFTLSGSNVTCEYAIAPDLWDIEASKVQINQVIHNIVINAVQAMPIGGTINIAAENIFLPKNNDFGLNEAHYIRVIIQDHGIGIDPNDLPHIFDPFYQSSVTGKGMGLTVVHNIITQHNGYISLDSEIDVGTTVYFYLPAVKPKIAAVQETPKEFPSHSGKILIMDDEEVIRKVLSKMLVQLGYEPYSVSEGSEAVKIYSEFMQQGKKFAAVILDLTIRGGMGGEETVKQLKNMDPEIKAVASSGYSTDKIMTDSNTYGFSGILIKPYKVTELKDTLNRLFN